MLIKKISPLSGREYEMEIDITQEKLDYYESNKNDILIQNLFPNLTIDEREFIKTGIPAEEWDDIFKEQEALSEAENYNEYDI